MYLDSNTINSCESIIIVYLVRTVLGRLGNDIYHVGYYYDVDDGFELQSIAFENAPGGVSLEYLRNEIGYFGLKTLFWTSGFT